MEASGLTQVIHYLPAQVQTALRQMAPFQQAQLQEVRLRADRPAAVCLLGKEWFLMPDGACTDDPAQGIRITRKMVEQTFQASCEYSVYRYAKEIQEGFLTVAGGNRVGIAGTAVYRDGNHLQLCHISGLNFRIARAVSGCAGELFRQTCGVQPSGVLLVGAVGSGKTTMLRDFCRMAGNVYRVTLVDERSEIAAMHRGVPCYDVGAHTDVLDGFPRAEGLLTALRVLTPQLLVCDEIGTQADAEAIARIHGCGVPVVASAHGTSWKDLQQRQVLRNLLDARVFSYGALLHPDQPGKIREFKQLEPAAIC